MSLKVFNGAGQAHVSTSGFVNYLGGGDRDKTAQEVWQEFPGAVVVNGSDNWHSPREARPQALVSDLGIEKLAYFHTGISGMTYSGVVLSQEEFEKLEKAVKEKFGGWHEYIRIYKQEGSF